MRVRDRFERAVDMLAAESAIQVWRQSSGKMEEIFGDCRGVSASVKSYEMFLAMQA